jgi:hypothetical protein
MVEGRYGSFLKHGALQTLLYLQARRPEDRTSMHTSQGRDVTLFVLVPIVFCISLVLFFSGEDLNNVGEKQYESY